MATYAGHQEKKVRAAIKKKHEDGMIRLLKLRGMTDKGIDEYMDNYRRKEEEEKAAEWKKQQEDAKILHEKWILEHTDENGIFVAPEYTWVPIIEDDIFEK